MSETRWSYSDGSPYQARVTGNSDAVHVVTGCGCDLERRIKVRMAEAEDAASAARERTVDLVKRAADSPARQQELVRLWALARTHEQLAEALGAVLEGGF